MRVPMRRMGLQKKTAARLFVPDKNTKELVISDKNKDEVVTDDGVKGEHNKVGNEKEGSTKKTAARLFVSEKNQEQLVAVDSEKGKKKNEMALTSANDDDNIKKNAKRNKDKTVEKDESGVVNMKAKVKKTKESSKRKRAMKDDTSDSHEPSFRKHKRKGGTSEKKPKTKRHAKEADSDSDKPLAVKAKGKGGRIEKKSKTKRHAKEAHSDSDEPLVVKAKGKKSMSNERTSATHSHIRLRSSPKPLNTTMKTLSVEQKQCLQNLGFASIVEFKIEAIPWRLGYFIVDCFDDEKMRFKLKHGELEVTKIAISEMLGVTLGGYPIETLDIPDEEDDIVVS